MYTKIQLRQDKTRLNTGLACVSCYCEQTDADLLDCVISSSTVRHLVSCYTNTTHKLILTVHNFIIIITISLSAIEKQQFITQYTSWQVAIKTYVHQAAHVK